MSKAGQITSTRTVHCYSCEASYTAAPDSSLAASEREWMGLGWCRFNLGWYCPACVPTHVESLKKWIEKRKSQIHINLLARGSRTDARSVEEVEAAIGAHLDSSVD